MKMHELKRKVGEMFVPIWPPSWASSYGPGSKFAVGEEGVLKGVRRIGDRLSLTMEYDGREHLGALEWTPPPTLDAVENVLKASIGKPIKAISGIDV